MLNWIIKICGIGLLGLCLTLPALADVSKKPAQPEKKIIRAAVIGGMTMTGMWQAVSKMFEKETGYTVTVVVTGPRPKISPYLRRGEVDILTMHSGDVTTDLVADGYGTPPPGDRCIIHRRRTHVPYQLRYRSQHQRNAQRQEILRR